MLVINVFATGCYHQFYRSGTKSLVDADMMQKLQASDKYFILHLPDRTIHLQNLTVKDNQIEAEEALLQPEHSRALNPDTSNSNNIKKRNKKFVLTEVHLYSNMAAEKSGRISLPLSTIYRIDDYKYDAKATRSNYIFSTAGLVLPVLAVIIVGATMPLSFSPW